jgi:plasmid stabilization system protein ParE
LSYRLHPAADTELADAVAFHQREAGSGVAKRFLDEFERVAALLVE